MTQDETIHMAREAWLDAYSDIWVAAWIDQLERFSAIVEDATKEKAAKVLDKQIVKLKQVLDYCEADEADAIKSTAWQISVLAAEVRGMK